MPEEKTPTDAVLTETAPTEEQLEAPQTQPLSQEKIAELVAQEVQKATVAIKAEQEKAQRELQSTKDRGRAEVEAAQRRARLAEETLAGYDKGLGQDDPDRAEVIRLRAEKQARQKTEIEENQRREMQGAIQFFENTLTQYATSLGIDPKDSRLDWGNDVSQEQLQTRQARFLNSTAQIIKEQAKAAEEKRSQEIKDVEARLRKDLGVDSVDTSTSPPTEGDDEVFLKKYMVGESDDHARAKKISDKIKRGA